MIRRFIFLLPLAIGAVRAADAPAASAVRLTAVPAAAPGQSSPVSAAPTRATTGPAAQPAPARNDSSIAPPSTGTFETFRLVSDRNIFNPNRTGRRDRTEEQPPRTDIISLVGTLESEHGLRSFFDGSDSGFRKALRVGDTIDKFKVVKITPNVVDLERDGKIISMRVGQQLRRPEGADWNLMGEEAGRREISARAETTNPTTPAVIPADASDTLRRLMEQRAKQLKQ
jgi:hypothetical protein